MRQTGLSKIAKNLWGRVALIFLLSLTTISCDNFLNAGDLKQQLDEAIEIANSSSVTYFIEPVNANGNITGTVNPSSVLVRKKETFEVIFKPTGNYQFEKWEVLDRKTRKPVTDSLSFENIHAPETKITVVNPKEGLIIHPKCILQPAVEQIIPNPSGQNQISSIIKIKFNMPVDDSVIEKISLFCLGINMAPYFDTPTLNERKDTLYLHAKTKEMLNFIKNLQKGSVDVNVYLPDSITVKIEGKDVPLKQDSNSSFVFHYVVVSDATDPVSLDFLLSREYVEPGADISTVTRMHDEILLMEEGQSEMQFIESIQNNSTQQVYLDNLCGPYVYIYGKVRDEDSGISNINVYEQYCGGSGESNKGLGRKEQAKLYNSDAEYELDENKTGTWFFTDTDGTTSFCIKHYVKAENGAVNISATASDAYNHAVDLITGDSSKTEITVFKQGNIVFDLQGGYYINNDFNIYNNGYSAPLTKQKLYSLLKTVWVYSESDNYFPYTDIQIPASYHTITCEYEHTDGGIRTDELVRTNDYYWKLPLDVEQMSGLHLKFTIKDILGNVSVKEYSIPKSEGFIGYQIPNASDPSKAEVHFLYNTGEFACPPVPVIDDGDGVLYYGDWDYYKYKADIEAGHTYQFIPCVGLEFDNDAVVRFYTEIPAYKYSIQSSISGSISTQNYTDTELPYKISKNSRGDLLDVTVQIASDSWSKGYTDILLFAEGKGFIQGQYNEERNDFSAIQEGNKIEAFEHGKYECTITCLTQLMYQSETKLYIYGAKDGVCSQKTQVTIDQLDYEDVNYDNSIIGHVTESSILSEKVTIPFNDYESGIDTIYTCIIEGDDVLNKYGTDIKKKKRFISDSGRFLYMTQSSGTMYERTIEISRWLYTDSGFTWFLTDRAGNVRYGVVNPNKREQYFKITSFNKKTENGTDSIIINAQRVKFDNVQPKKILVYEWDTDNNKWGTEKSTTCTKYTDLKLTKGTGYSADKFIKVVLFMNGSIACQKYSNPYFVYTGTSNTRKYDYRYEPFNGTIAITSDAPVFARTVVTTASYEECKNWTVEQWEDGKKCIRERYLPCSTSEHQQLYKVWDPATDYGIDHARCYAAIIHFADGSRAVAWTFENPSFISEE